ncbi:sugar phosphate isomerase/epimerase [Emticicia sp. BO119]|uniref:sugar phosphate isomerase/epimerase family protein n=1 Tax=Emticicia sp. BO119 TaxID=2757768 RepID=UPI0015F0C5CD|nr:sugar phosphate isomerase/epimerase [Emticicia sp. BO119]MBA4853469.1 sugar phosphate isomerase/epimerase [Emticicia sp. BO119]
MKKILFYSLLSLLFSQEVNAQKKKPLYKAPFAVQTYTYRNVMPKDVPGTLDLIKSLGVTEIEGGGAKGVTLEEFKKMCDDRGIKIPSTGIGYEQLRTPEETVKRAKILGSTYVMCAWIPHKGDNFTIEEAKKAVEDFNYAGKIFKENGITFCYHDHGYEFRPYEDGTLMDYIIKNTNPEYVSFEMDVLWTIHGGGDPVALMKKYGNRWKLMHVKDLKKGITGDFSGHTPAENDVVLGTGQADWVNIFKEANKIGIKHFFIEDESNNELVNVPKSIEYLKNLKE